MNSHSQGLARATLGAVLGLLAALMLSTGASASSGLNLPALFAPFDYCPLTAFANHPGSTVLNTRCLYTLTEGGSVTLGKKVVPIVNPVTFRGAFGKAAGSEIIGGTTYTHISPFFEASGGPSLSDTPQPVPGGLLGLIPPASSPPSIRALTALYNERGASNVTATLEAAGEIFVSEFDLLIEEEVAQRMPVKIHLENPFLGSSCYIGSNSSPIIWNLTTGPTSPPAPNKPIVGSTGALGFEDNTKITHLVGAQLVDNAWSAPVATGCGGALAPIVDPLVDASIGLPSPAGRNTAILGNIYIHTASQKAVEEELP